METVATWEARTGRRYRPPAALRVEGTPLEGTDTCPPLYRYPGPCGLRGLFSGALSQLAPRGNPQLWLSEHPLHGEVPGAALFGTVLLRDPLHVSPVRTERPGIWVGRNVDAAGAGGLEWIAPSRVLGRASPVDPREEREQVLASLQTYLEELACLQAAGADPPHEPWCRLPQDERRKRLRQAGVKPQWTGRLDAGAHLAT